MSPRLETPLAADFKNNKSLNALQRNRKRKWKALGVFAGFFRRANFFRKVAYRRAHCVLRLPGFYVQKREENGTWRHIQIIECEKG